MDSLEANKAIASVLVAGVAFMVATIVADNLVHPKYLEKTAITIEMPKPAAATAKAAPETPLPVLLASADVKAGDDFANKVCAVCHSLGEGQPAKLGPNLYGIVGDPHAHMQGYDYSAAIKAKKGKWTFAALNDWLTDPQTYAPGTKMTYAGIKSAKMRADVIAYLRTLSKNPEPLPKVTPAMEAPAKAPAAGAAAPAAKAAAGGPSFDQVLATASADEGHELTQKYCSICHSFDKGGKAIIGPNLYGIVGDKHAHMAGFDYSDALKSKKGPWTYGELNEWLTNPSAYAPGTRMGFAGLHSEKQRAEIVAYLRTLSDHPEPLPAAGGATPAKAEAPAK